MKILTIGGGMRDIFLHYPCTDLLHMHTTTQKHAFIILEEGTKIKVDAVEYHIGGGAANSAVSLSRLGFQTSCFFKLGNDTHAEEIINRMHEETINTEFVVHSDTTPTGTSFIIPCSSQNRAVLVYRGANLTVSKSEIPYVALQEHDGIYITSLSENASLILPEITYFADQHFKKVAVNPGTSQLTARVDTLIEALPAINILILNAYEAHMLMYSLKTTTHIDNKVKITPSDTALPSLLRMPLTAEKLSFPLRQFFAEILKRGPDIVAVTNGAEGVYVTDGTQIFFHPSLPIKLVSTLGAGDAFGSCFVGALMHGKPISNAIRCGILNSTSVLQYMDTQTGLLHWQDLEKRLISLDSLLLQNYPL